MIKIITVKDVEGLPFLIAKEFLTYNEPIPAFRTRFPNILESCLATPFQTFYRKPLYRGLISKASILFYLMIKNHPFQNGNKRIGIATLFVFLSLNGKWLKFNSDGLYYLSVSAAESPPQYKNEIVKMIEKFLKSNIKDSPII
jgi:death on curing protein